MHSQTKNRCSPEPAPNLSSFNYFRSYVSFNLFEHNHSMKRILIILCTIIGLQSAVGQTNPAITSLLLNTTGVKGRHFLSGSSAVTEDTLTANVLSIQYSATFAYVKANGIPSYVTGPFTNNPQPTAKAQNRLYKIPLNPAPKTGTRTSVGPGRNGIFINGVPFFNAGDGRSYLNQNKWHNNAYIFEQNGFDCNRGHPEVQGSYHHHMNPSAFHVASVVNSTICNLYLTDGLYVPDSTKHGPLIGFAFDGYPVYGAYGYSNPLDTASPIKRMKPSYQLRNITDRSTLPDGSAATGPAINANIQNPGTVIVAVLGAYKEDYEFVQGSGDLDESNVRFCKTPEYPNGTYCYFATIDRAGNPVYPYLTGPTYFGVVETTNTQPAGPTITEPVTTYIPSVTAVLQKEDAAPSVLVYPNPTHEMVVIQSAASWKQDRTVEVISSNGTIVLTEKLRQGSTMCFFDTQTLRSGIYLVRILTPGGSSQTSKIVIGE
jgi:YHYH protein/Secretion system C-terminal sorting domain